MQHPHDRAIKEAGLATFEFHCWRHAAGAQQQLLLPSKECGAVVLLVLGESVATTAGPGHDLLAQHGPRNQTPHPSQVLDALSSRATAIERIHFFMVLSALDAKPFAQDGRGTTPHELLVQQADAVVVALRTNAIEERRCSIELA